MPPLSASHSRPADSLNVSSTDLRSKVDDRSRLSDELIVLEHRHANGRAGAAKSGWRAGVGSYRIIGDVGHFSCPNEPIENGSRGGLERPAPMHELGVG